MKKIFECKNAPKPSSLEFHVLSCAILDWDNNSGHESTPREIWGSNLAESYKNRHKVCAIVYSNKRTNKNRNKPELVIVQMNQRNKKGTIIKNKHYGKYERYYMWILSKEMAFYHENCWYQLLWLIKYIFAWIKDKIKGV